MGLKPGIRITSIKFKTNAQGDWTFLYNYTNTGLLTFGPGQLKFKSTQILANGVSVPIHTTILNTTNAPGTKSSAHSFWDRCSAARTLMLEIIYKGRVLDKKIVMIPFLNIKITNLSKFKTQYKTSLKNNTSYTSKVFLRLVSNGSAKGGGSLSSRTTSEKMIIIPANSLKTVTGNIANPNQNSFLELIFKDEKKCSGKGYIILDKKQLTCAGTKTVPKPGNNIPAGIKNTQPKIAFQIVNSSLYNYLGLNRSFSVYFTFSKRVDPSTMKDSAVEFYLRSYEHNRFIDETHLVGKWLVKSGNKNLQWKTNPLASSFRMINVAPKDSYYQIDVSVHNVIKSEDGELLDGDADGKPGGWPYKHRFYIGK